MASTYLTRTPSSQGNRRTWTWSGWIKMSSVTSRMSLFSANNAQNNNQWVELRTNTSGTLSFSWWSEGVFTTNQLFRDPSAWYHIVLAVDTTQATDTNRVKCYVNGEQVTSFSSITYPTQNYDTGMFMTTPHDIGRLAYSSNFYFDGYMADINFIDGTQYAASDFGQTDSTGIWKPKGFSGTYGTNGAYLKMSNSGDLGADSSGNSNNFTKSGNGRQRTDTPSNVFATINPLANYYNPSTLSQGNLRVDFDSGVSTIYNISTLGVTTGKWYCEIDAVTIPGYAKIGIASRPCKAGGNSDNLTVNQYNYGYSASNGNVDSDATAGGPGGTYIGYGATWTSGDIIGIGLDLDNNRLYFSKNGTWQNSADPAAGTGGVVIADPTSTIDGAYYFAVGDNRNDYATRMDCNFGNPITTISSGNADGNGYGNFEYAPPTGYLALCTKNLATEAAPTIDDGSAYFQAHTFTGNGGTQTLTFAGNSNLQPDWMWFKERNLATNWHQLWDTSRGIGVSSSKRLYSNATSAEADITSGTGVRGVGTNTVEVGSTAGINGSSQPIVLWAWKVNGGTTSTNTDGTITTTVQVNSTTKNSIITWTGNGSSGSTVGHGLGVTPTLVIAKVRNVGDNWLVFHPPGLNESKTLWMDSTDAVKNASTYYPIFWNSTDPNSSVITLGNNGAINGNGNTYVAYCFRDVEGYSKFGTYTGNGSADGTFIYTGFRPAFTIIKKSSDAGVWFMYDTTRDIDNKVQHRLLANDPQAENTGSGDDIDIVSNGIKVRSSASAINASGQTFFYMAFAENPFVTSGGLPVTAR